MRRSRFIAVVQHVSTVEEARGQLAELRREFHDARHLCSAYVIGPRREIQRSHDDGEPSGTAGAPMLEAVLKRVTRAGRTDLSDVAVVVVRYFGGVLLGAGGLVRAYSESVSRALDSAPFVRRRLQQVLDIKVPHADAGRLEHSLRSTGIEIIGHAYGHSVTISVAVPASAPGVSGFEARLASLTAGARTAERTSVRWVDSA